MKRFLLLAFFLPFLSLAQTTAGLPPSVHHQFLDKNGKPLSGGKIYTCIAGTSCPGNPLATYKDAAEVVTNTNPIILDYSGYADLWLDTNSVYKLVALDRNNVTQWTQDQVSINPGFIWLLFTPLNATGSTISITNNGSSYLRWGTTVNVTTSMILVFAGTPINDVALDGVPFTTPFFQILTCAVSVDGGINYAPGFAYIPAGSNMIHFRKGDSSTFPIGSNVVVTVSGAYHIN